MAHEDEDAPPLKKRRKMKLSLSKSLETKDCTVRKDTNSALLDRAREPSENEDRGVETSENEAYFSANFKSVCNSVFAEDSFERHVFTESDRDVIKQFMALPSKPINHLILLCIIIHALY